MQGSSSLVGKTLAWELDDHKDSNPPLSTIVSLSKTLNPVQYWGTPRHSQSFSHAPLYSFFSLWLNSVGFKASSVNRKEFDSKITNFTFDGTFLNSCAFMIYNVLMVK